MLRVLGVFFYVVAFLSIFLILEHQATIGIAGVISGLFSGAVCFAMSRALDLLERIAENLEPEDDFDATEVEAA